MTNTESTSLEPAPLGDVPMSGPDRLREVADLLEALPWLHDQNSWVSARGYIVERKFGSDDCLVYAKRVELERDEEGGVVDEVIVESTYVATEKQVAAAERLREEKGVDCGTSACIAGWGAILDGWVVLIKDAVTTGCVWVKDGRGRTIQDLGVELFGLTYIDGARLFSEDWRPELTLDPFEFGREPTVSDALRAIADGAPVHGPHVNGFD